MGVMIGPSRRMEISNADETRANHEARLLQSRPYTRLSPRRSPCSLLSTVTNIAHAADAGDSHADYASLQRAVLDGEDIRVVLDLSACRHNDPASRDQPRLAVSLRWLHDCGQQHARVRYDLLHRAARQNARLTNSLRSEFIRQARLTLGRDFSMRRRLPVRSNPLFNCSFSGGVTYH
jgi:hypothetical protein